MTAHSKTLQYDVARQIVSVGRPFYVAPREYSVVSFDAAMLLARHHSRLAFPGLRRISPRVASALATVKGVLALRGLSTIQKSVARALATHEGKLVLRNLVNVDTESLEILAGHPGPVFLPSLRPLPADDRRQRAILARHGNLRYDADAVDVFEGIDFSRFRWHRTDGRGTR